MSLIIISAGDVTEFHGTGTPSVFKLFANKQFTESGGIVVAQGSKSKPSFYQGFSCSLVGQNIRVATDAAYSTVDSSDPTATYTGVVYDSRGRELITVFTNLRIPADPSPISWNALRIFSAARTLRDAPTYLSSQQILELLGQYSSTALKASTSVYGVTKLSAEALTLNDPIAVADNDARWVGIKRTVYMESYGATHAALVTALAAIGSTQTELKITSQISITDHLTIPANVLVTFEGNGSITVANTKTLTISSMGPVAPYQIFFGSGSVVFGKNATGGQFHIEWWAGIASASNVTAAFVQAATSQTNNAGGVLHIGPGTWQIANWTAPSYGIVKGSGVGSNGVGGTVLQIDISLLSGFPAVVKVSEAFRHVVFEDLTFSVSTSTNANCFLAAGTSPNTAVGLVFNRCAFHSGGATSAAQFWLKDLGGTWQLEEVHFNHCEWITPNSSRSVQIDTPNTSVYINQGLFAVGTQATCIYGVLLGFLKMTGCQFAGTGFSATAWTQSTNRTITQASITNGTNDLTIATGAFSLNDVGRRVIIGVKLDAYITEVTSSTAAQVSANASATATNESMLVKQWDESTGRAGIGVHIVGAHGNIHLDNCSDEGFNYLIKNDASDMAGVITLTNCWVQSWIQLDQSCTLASVGNHYFSQTFRDGASSASRITSIGDFIDEQTVTGTLVGTLDLLKPRIWGQKAGISFFQAELNNYGSLLYKQGINFPTTFNYGQDFRFAPDTTNGIYSFTSSIDTTGGPHINLIEWGRSDAITEQPLYTYKLQRDFDNGFSNFRGNQAKPYRGYNFDSVVEADTFRGLSVNAPQITTDVAALYQTEYKRMVRITSNAAHTVASFVWANIGGTPLADDEAILINVGSFSMTFLHEDLTFSAQDRFICNTGSSIVLAPNEIAYIWHDATTTRNRIAKLNISGLTSDKTTITAEIALLGASSIKSSSPTAGIGYGTGAGGTVAQATSKSTAVTVNAMCGAITMHNASLADATTVTFTVNNTSALATDIPKVIHKSGGTLGSYLVQAHTPAANSFKISVRNLSGGALGEALVLTFALERTVTS